MPNYGLVTTSKFGSGSFYAPYDTNRQKALRIDPIGAGNFEIAAGQDFYISVWIKYGTLNVRTTGKTYPIIKYGEASSYYPGSGWEIGMAVNRVGQANSGQPYFSFRDINTNQLVTLTTYFNGYNGDFTDPSGGWDQYEVFRTNGVIHFQFTSGGNKTRANAYGYRANSTYATANYNGRIGYPVKALVDAGYLSEDYKGIFVGSEQPYVVNQDNGAYIDDLFFARDVSAVQNYNADGSINDGKLTTTVLLYQFNGNIVDTVGMTQVADAIQLVSTSTFTARATEQFVDSAHLVSTFTLTATTTNIPRVKYGEAHLNSSSSLIANGIKPVYGTATLNSRTTLTVQVVQYYPRPNGTWTNPVSMYPKYSQWQNIYVDNITFPATQGKTILFDWGGYQIQAYGMYNGSGTTYYLGINDYWQQISQAGQTFNLRVTRTGSAQAIFSGATYDLGNWNFNPTVSSNYTSSSSGTVWTYLTQYTIPNATPPSTPTQLTAIGNFYGSNTGGITTPAHYLRLNTWRARSGIDVGVTPGTWLYAWSFIRNYPGYPVTAAGSNVYSYTTAETFNISVTKTAGALRVLIVDTTANRVVLDYTDYQYGITNPDTYGYVNGNYQPIRGNWTGVAQLPTVTRSSTGNYFVALSGSNLLLTRSGFDYTSTVVSTNPYVVNNQNYILGLYDQLTAVDRTGTKTNAQASLTSQTTFTVQATKVIVAQGAISSQTQLTANLTKQVRTGAQLQSTTSWQATSTKGLFGVSRLTSQSTVSATAKKYPGATANLVARSTVILTPYNFTKYQATLQASTQLTGISLRIKQLQSQLQALASEVVAIARIRHGETYLESRTTLTAQTTIRNNPYLPLTATTTLTANNLRIRYADAHLQVTSTTTANNGHLRYADAHLSSTSSLSLTPIRIRPGRADLQAQSTETAHTENSRKPGTTARLVSTSRLTATNQIVRLGQAHLNVTSTMYGTAGVVVFGYCSWQAFSSELISGRLIDIDPYTTISIQPESRGLIVLPESRIISIKQETRVNIIKDTL